MYFQAYETVIEIRRVLAAFVAGALSLAGCALPVPRSSEIESFISDKELDTVALAREGMWYFNQSRYIDAELRFRQVLARAPGMQNIMVNLAATLEREGLYEEAQGLYEQVLEQDPRCIPCTSGLAHLHYSAERYDTARQTYESALAMALDAADDVMAANIARSLAALAFKVGDEEGALCYSSLVMRLRGNPDDFLRRVKFLSAAGRHADVIEAILALGSTRNIERDWAVVHARAMAAFGLGNLAEAVSFEKLALQNPGIDPALSFEMRLVLRVAGEALETGQAEASSDEAEEAFQTALLQFAEGDKSAMLYWPVNLVEMTQDYIDRQKPEAWSLWRWLLKLFEGIWN